jgi:hypothetical protein
VCGLPPSWRIQSYFRGRGLPTSKSALDLVICSNRLIYIAMTGGQDISMIESFETRFDALMNAINALSTRLTDVEGVAHNNSSSGATSTTAHHPFTSVPEEVVPPVIRQDTLHIQQRKEPRVSMPEKFDGTRSKFRGFINQVQLITMLQPERYPTEESKVGLVGTLLTGSALSWFAVHFEQRSPILTNFETFIAALTEAFGEHDKARVALNKIYALQQGSRSVSVYASEYRQLAAGINWDEQALMDQFYRGLRDDVKDLLLNFPDPCTLDEAIRQAVKCDNRLFQRYQDRRSSSSSRQSAHTALTKVHDSYQGVEDMQIDATRFKPLTPEEKKRRFEENLCLYCGEPGHKAGSCPKKRKLPVTKIRSATISENKDGQSQ